MNALDVMKQVYNGISVPPANISFDSGDEEVSEVLSLMNTAGEEIARRGDWSQLIREFTVADDQNAADLPDTFYKLLSRGVEVNREPRVLVVSSEMWAQLEETDPLARNYYHLKDGQINFIPNTMGAITFRYISKNWVVDKELITTETDTFRIPARLIREGAIWRWYRKKQMPYDDYLAQYEANFMSEYKADRGEA